jgi:dTDP-4-dehydrorhamnose reductase
VAALPTPVAVTGASGRLGRALVAQLRNAGHDVREWSRPDYDLDDPDCAARLVDRDAPRMVIHAAAWTDVDGCAEQPELAARRNGAATGELAAACASRRVAMVLVSTNEVFDGRRDDARGYREGDPVAPINPYGRSKLAGERLARDAFDSARRSDQLWIVRTAWLFGPPGNDFPTKILAAARASEPDKPLRVVTDEVGSPTFAAELAPALLQLIRAAPGDTYHLAAPGSVSRHDLARAVLDACRIAAPLEPTTRAEYARPSQPPAWSVLDSGRAAAYGVRLRPWQDAVREYAATIC